MTYQKHEVSISFQGRIKNCEAASSHFIDSVSNLMRFSFLFAKDHCEVYRLFFFLNLGAFELLEKRCSINLRFGAIFK